MHRLDITKVWNKLGPEGQAQELKHKVYECLLGIQQTFSHPDEYTWLKDLDLELSSQKHPDYQQYKDFRNEMETGNYSVTFSLEKTKNDDDTRSVYLVADVVRNDKKAIQNVVRQNIGRWAVTVGAEELEGDINRILNMQNHVPAFGPNLFGKVAAGLSNDDEPSASKPRKRF